MLNAIKNRVFGQVLPQEFTLGFPEPQTEIAVWLHGTGAAVDVTNRHSVACEAPLTFGIGIGDDLGRWDLDQLSLNYCRRGEQQVLGEIRRKRVAALLAGQVQGNFLQDCDNAGSQKRETIPLGRKATNR